MKSKLEFIPLILFIITAILSFIIDNKEAGLGFIVAAAVQIRVIILLYFPNEELKEK